MSFAEMLYLELIPLYDGADLGRGGGGGRISQYCFGRADFPRALPKQYLLRVDERISDSYIGRDDFFVFFSGKAL